MPRDEATARKVGFSDVPQEIPAAPGIYEIWTHSGMRLKVGISFNLKNRLSDHKASRDSGLKFSADCDTNDPKPGDVRSRKSVLAKHLYFDKTLTTDGDLTTEQKRRDFLLNSCYITFKEMPSRADARRIEKEIENQARYFGAVVSRVHGSKCTKWVSN